ncbi:MAG TPA: 6-phosphogluconolactonase [Xenococcaceae cyanobacterium]
MKKFVETLPDRQTLIQRAGELILNKIQAGIKLQEKFTMALAGGSTPKPLYEFLATQSLPWEKIHVFWGDERYVSAIDANSNQLMARQAWLNKVTIPVENIHPVPTDAQNPELDAQNHEAEIKEFFQLAPGEFPSFDLILLGIGDDGHTASLFPHTAALQERDRLVTVGDKNGEPRITFTVPVINQGQCVMFLVSGANKRPALTQIFAEEGDDLAYPARLIEAQAELWWLLDQEAGTALKDRGLSSSFS